MYFVISSLSDSYFTKRPSVEIGFRLIWSSVENRIKILIELSTGTCVIIFPRFDLFCIRLRRKLNQFDLARTCVKNSSLERVKSQNRINHIRNTALINKHNFTHKTLLDYDILI